MEQTNGGNSFIERRAYRRFRLKEMVAFAYTPDIKTLGRVVDISRGGMQLEYIPDSSQPRNPEKVDLFVLGRKFHIRNLPCRRVYDLPVVSREDRPFHIPIATRRCGIQFREPSDMQQRQLEMFIETYVEENRVTPS